ncbi:MAG: hypothetical protein CMN29_33615 [Sandaracinus sp.]|nr:hypothetical protein [Sandaracinus sp.]
MRYGARFALTGALLLAVTGTAWAQTGEDAAPDEGAPADLQMPANEAPPADADEPAGAPVPTSSPATESRCDDGADDDGDGMVDCADADCFEDPICEANTGDERNDERCSDWVDNDGDGMTDCEDTDCTTPPVTVCEGSAARMTPASQPNDGEEDLPELEGDMSAEDLIGGFGDADGERNDYLCSDGADNDGDGRTDCADFGCRFDPQVTVCTASPGYRFGVVAGVGFEYDAQADDDIQTPYDVRFTRLQLRALGQIPYIENSFFLISARLERSPRITFAHFQIPVGNRGHYVAINSGGGNLSSALIISTAKQPLLDPPFYMLNEFEEGNGAAMEAGGPLLPSGRLRFRVFAAGGSGRSNGNVGGRFFPDDNQNFTYTAGAQLHLNFIGHFGRFDSPLLYTKVPLGLGMLIGGKWDQRADERYPAANALLVFKHSYFLFRFENYFKYSLDFGGSVQNAFNAQLSVLLYPRWLMFAADFGMYRGGDFDEDELPTEGGPQQPRNEWQARAALHLWWYRNIGLLSLLYTERHLEDLEFRDDDQNTERSVRVEVQFRF